MKNIFYFRKLRHRGIAENPHWLKVTAALDNLNMVRRPRLKT